MSFLVAGAIVAGTAGLAKLGVAISGRKKRIDEQNKAKKEHQKMMAEYKALDTSNPYANMQNTMEDLTVNQQQAQFQAQQGAQQRANVMQSMQAAAGGSGIAALAQAMANQGQLATQQAGASIGMQEQRNQMAAARQAASIQQLERKGEERSQDLQYQKTSTMLGMSQQRLAAANQARAEAKAQQMSAIGDIGAAGMKMMGGTGGGGGSAVPVDQNRIEPPSIEDARQNALANQRLVEQNAPSTQINAQKVWDEGSGMFVWKK